MLPHKMFLLFMNIGMINICNSASWHSFSTAKNTEFKKLNQNPCRSQDACLACLILMVWHIIPTSNCHVSTFLSTDQRCTVIHVFSLKKIWPLCNLISSAIESLMPCYYLVNCWNCIFLFHFVCVRARTRMHK